MESKIEKTEDKMYKKMTEAPVAGLVCGLAWPMVISMLTTSIYNMADTYFVSKLGNSATGAVGIVYSIQSVIQAVGYGLGMGASSLISRRLGAKDGKSANMYASSAFAAAIAFGIILMAVGLLNLKGMMRIFGSTETILPYAEDYGLYILLGAPVMCSAFVLNNVLRAEGRARFAMIGLTSGGIINIVLDPVFISLLNLGVSGAAIATVLSQIVSFCMLLLFFIAGKSEVKLSYRYISHSFGDYFTIVKTGMPTVCRQGLGSVATTLLNVRVKIYGDAAIAAMSIANKIYMLIRNVIVGVGQGFQPVAGYNYGADKKKRVKKSFSAAVLMGTVFSCAIAVLIAVFAGNIISLFRSGDKTVIEIGGTALRFMSLSLPVLAYSTYVNQLYQCLGFVKGATFLASCRQGIFYIPAILLLPEILAVTGIQLAQPVADLCTFFMSIPFNIWFYKKVLN